MSTVEINLFYIFLLYLNQYSIKGILFFLYINLSVWQIIIKKKLKLHDSTDILTYIVK